MSKLMRSALRLRSRVGARHASWASSISTALELPSDIRRRVREEPLAATYDPQSVEAGWNEYWQQAITAKKREETQGRSTRDAKHFNMLLPPPNVTGALHIGHALTVTIQDALARWHLMRGYNVRWVPGLDHAGIATQSVVERKLAKEEGKSRHDLGREAFLDRVWEWNKQYGGRIMHQLDLLGTIVNKDETYFTLDETRSKAVVEAFVKLHERGLIFRKRRMVNWCPSLKTAISDIEVDSESLTGPTLVKVPGRLKPVEFGVMHRILYKVADSNEFLEVDTTRPETIFGDVAVAVHPDDPRYQRYHGMYVEHPFSGERIPIVVDDVLVNMELGTGVVKVTPAHDPKDYECGLRHNLPKRFVINKDGRMCGNVPIQYAGMNRFDAREFVVDELKTRELYVSKLDHPTSISKCSRSGDIIEPLLMPQWFVDCRKMAERAVDNVRSGRLTIEPRSHEHMWYFFLENIQDWCVSRQLWWGHRIPAYRLDLPGHDDEWVVARSIDEARAKAIETFGDSAQHATINQDDDVLDTWFSSGLLPVSIAGWPEDDPVKSSVYPLSVMETGSDILFFWVARMAMLCEEFSGTVPFERILLHPMVRDKAGRKMSKSLGNVIDPIHVIQGISLDDLIAGLRTGNVGAQEMQRAEKELRKEFPNGIPPCGTDALRYALASYLQQGRQINMDIQRVVSHRQFCNKIWNAVRYALPLLNQDATTIKSSTQTLESLKADGRTGLAERWILSRLASTVEEVNKSMEANQLASSVAAFQRFFIQDLCDVYIEFSKPILYCNRINVEEFGSEYDVKQRQAAARLTLYTCLDFSMRLLHPFAPFVTEELWQRIRTYDPTRAAENDTSLLFATYPEAHHVSTWIDQHAEKEMNLILSVLHATRSLRHTVKTLAPNGAKNADMQVYVRTSDSGESTVLLDGLRDLENQSRLRMNVVSEKCDALSSPTLCQSISQTCQVMIPVPGDSETLERARSEVQRLEKRLKKQTTALEGLTNRQSSPDYEAKVPEAIREQDTVRADQLRTDLDTTEASIRAIKQLELQYVV